MKDESGRRVTRAYRLLVDQLHRELGSYKAVAERLGVSPSYLSRIRGGQRVGLHLATRAADAVGVSPMWFHLPDPPHYSDWRKPAPIGPSKALRSKGPGDSLAEVEQLHATDNAAHAARLRALADRIEAEGRPVRGYAAILVYADGSVGSEFDTGPATAPLLGALELLRHRVVGTWMQD